MSADPRQPPAAHAAEAIELAAAEWLVLQDHGLDAAQQREFQRWLDSDPRHASAYARIKETWRMLDGVPAERLPLPPRRGRRVWWITTAVAAAAAAMAVVLLRPTVPVHRVLKPVDRAATALGGFESLALPDGSTVRLNTSTELAVNFSATERHVTLRRGEASFEVKKDPARPFVVRAGDVDVRVVGTVFNVRQNDRAIEVLVVEGKVRINDAASGRSLVAGETAASSTDSAPEPVLTAGQRATIDRSTPASLGQASVARVESGESARALAWHSGQLDFSNEPLASIAAEFNRYNRHRLVIDDAELGKQRFGGKFPADDFAAFVRLLELNFEVVVERRENETVLRRRTVAR